MKPENKSAFVLLGGIVVCSVSISCAHADQTCDSVYQNATRDIDVVTKTYQQLDYTFDNYCNKDGSTKSINIDDSVSAIFDDLPFSFSSKKGDTESRISEFCHLYSSERYVDSRYYHYKNDVQVAALAEYNECVALRTKGILLSYEADGLVGGSISGTFKDRTTALVIHSALYDKKLLSCKLSTDDRPSAITIDDTKPVKVDKNFTVICRRNFQTENGTQYYSSTDLRLDTNSGGYTVHFDGDSLNGYYVASQAKSQVEAMQKDLVLAKSNADTLMDRIKKATVSSYRFYNGDPGRDSYLTGPRRNCEANLMPYAQSVCGAKRKVFISKQAGGFGGGRCGYDYYNLACLDLDDSPLPDHPATVSTLAPAFEVIRAAVPAAAPSDASNQPK